MAGDIGAKDGLILSRRRQNQALSRTKTGHKMLGVNGGEGHQQQGCSSSKKDGGKKNKKNALGSVNAWVGAAARSQ
jgi:hypothetical protein